MGWVGDGVDGKGGWGIGRGRGVTWVIRREEGRLGGQSEKEEVKKRPTSTVSKEKVLPLLAHANC